MGNGNSLTITVSLYGNYEFLLETWENYSAGDTIKEFIKLLKKTYKDKHLFDNLK